MGEALSSRLIETGAMDAPAVILASASRARFDLLLRAGVPVRAEPARIDEEEVRASLRGENAAVADAAETLAELKARKVSHHNPGALIVGADQILDCAGAWFDKPPDRRRAAADLRALSGKEHVLVTAVCVVRDGMRLWHHRESARLAMRALDDGFIEAYLDAISAEALSSVGAYQLEGLGAQLFSRVEGDYFTILGLPLLPLLEFLRNHGVVAR
jgi:septum formation protein